MYSSLLVIGYLPDAIRRHVQGCVSCWDWDLRFENLWTTYIGLLTRHNNKT